MTKNILIDIRDSRAGAEQFIAEAQGSRERYLIIPTGTRFAVCYRMPDIDDPAEYLRYVDQITGRGRNDPAEADE